MLFQNYLITFTYSYNLLLNILHLENIALKKCDLDHIIVFQKCFKNYKSRRNNFHFVQLKLFDWKIYTFFFVDLVIFI